MIMLARLMLIITLTFSHASFATTTVDCGDARPDQISGAWSGLSLVSSDFYLLIINPDLSGYITISSPEKTTTSPLQNVRIQDSDLIFYMRQNNSDSLREFYFSLKLACGRAFDQTLLRPVKKLSDNPEDLFETIMESANLYKGKDGLRKMVERNQLSAEQDIKERGITIP